LIDFQTLCAIAEAKRKGVEVIGLVDTNSDPTEVNLAIPVNDDATAAVVYVLDLIKQAVLQAKSKKTKK